MNATTQDPRIADWLASKPGEDDIDEGSFTTSIGDEVDRLLVLHPDIRRADATTAITAARQRVCAHMGKTSIESAMAGDREYQVLVCSQCDLELDEDPYGN